MFTHTLGVSYKTDVGQIINTVKTYTGDEEFDIDGTVAGSVTNQEYDVAIDISKVKSLLMYSDQAVTVKTNDSGSPQDTIALKAGVPVVWNADQIDAIPFADDLTKFFVTNAGSTAANVKFRFVCDH